MDRTISLLVLLTAVLLLLYPEAESQWVPHRPLPTVHPPPLCASQIALANRACGMLPFTSVPPPSPTSPTPVPPSPGKPNDDHEEDNNDDDDNDNNDDEVNEDKDNSHDHHHHHHHDDNNRRRHDNDDDDDHRHNQGHGHGHHGHGHGHNHGHGHHHGHRHSRHGKGETPVGADCCRWLKEVDAVCVCEMLLPLPPFLVRPVHNYTVIVDDTCQVTFQCSSRWVEV